MHPGILATAGVTPLLPEWAAIALVLLTLTILLVTMRRISHSLKDWSLGSALSEEVTYKTSDGTTTREETKLEPSVSRYVALYGLVGILVLFIAFGLMLLWAAAEGVDIQAKAEQFSQYLMYGVVMFAPYAVNKFASLGEMFGSRR